MLELDCRLQFVPEFDTDFFNSMPSRPGVLLLEMHDTKAKPYLARTADIRRAAERLLVAPDAPSKRLNLRDVVAGIHYRVTGSKFEQMLTMYEQARKYFPDRYRGLLRLRPSALLKINLRNEYPRGYVTRRIRADGGFYFGPFASRRAAEAFSESFLDLFKTRRCQIKIRRDPAFPGCIYSEMKMCLAPCFAGCSKQEYDVEVGRVLATLESGGSFLIKEIQDHREAASEALNFEKAAALHKRLEKVSGTLRGWGELTRSIDEIDAVILQRGAEEKTIVVFPARAGILAEPLFLRFAELSSEPKSVEGMLRAVLDPQTSFAHRKPSESKEDSAAEINSPVKPQKEGASQQSREHQSEVPASNRSRYGLQSAPPELAEHLSLLSRWFYSNPREGEILFREDSWPYRRILRACNRLLAPTPGPPQEPQPGTQSAA
jgi:excinuclease UvrABC nuclease subunit